MENALEGGSVAVWPVCVGVVEDPVGSAALVISIVCVVVGFNAHELSGRGSYDGGSGIG